MEVVSLEFNTLHGTSIYAHSSAKLRVIIQIHECNILTAVLAEAYTESPMSIIMYMYLYQGMYLSSMDSYFCCTIISVLQLR